MKQSVRIRIVFMLLSTVLCIAACVNKKPKFISVNPGFAEYVSGYTSGTVSRNQNIRIELAEAFPSKNKKVIGSLPDSNVLKNIFDFEPGVKGKAVWLNNRVIEFVPDEPLPVNQLYTVTFDLDKVAKVKDDFEEFVFQFASYPQNMNVQIDGLRNYDDYDSEWQKLTGVVTTSDYADSLEVKKTLEVKVNNKVVPVKWTHSNSASRFYFYIDSIKKGLHEGRIDIIWNGEAIQSFSSGKQSVDIPAMGDFSVTQAKVVDEDDQTIELYFSEPIAYNQNLKGIIELEGVENLTYSIEGNVVRVFPGIRIEGNKEIKISTGLKNAKGYRMIEAYSTSLDFREPGPRVKLVGNGSILPNSGGLIFPFKAISLKAVDVRVIKIFQNNVHQFLQVNELDGEDHLTRVGKVMAEKTITLDYDKGKDLKQWNTHVIDLAKMVAPDPGAIYRISIKFKKEYALCNCAGEDDDEEGNEEEASEHEEEGLPLMKLFEEKKDEDIAWNENAWFRYSFDGGYDSWNDYYGDNYTPCNSGYYEGKAVSRNILASDIGLIYKLDENKLSHAFVSNMITAQPLPNCTIEYFDYTKQVIAKGTTDANGMLDVQLKQKPFLMVASYGKQRGYMKLLDGNANSLSKFDIEGEEVQKGIKGFIYGERGVWRPGDSLYLNFILEDKEKRLPPNHPVKFELQDPDGKIVSQMTKTEHVNGLYDFRTATSDEAATGTYMAVVRVGNRSFSQNIKIETVKPNRLKIYFDANTKQSAALKNDTIGKLRVQWLHGAIAGNLKTVVNASLTQTETKFEGYKNYIFDSPLRNYYGEEMTVFDGVLDKDGKAAIRSSFSAGKTAPGMLRANFVTRVFEEGGDFSVDRFSMPYSPYKTYIGLRIPETKNYNNALETGTSYPFEIASTDADGKPVNSEKVQLKVYKLQWRWWYEDDEDDLASYVSRSSTIIIRDTVLKTINGKVVNKFKINNEDYGRYLVTVTDGNGGHQTGKVVMVDWPYWSRGNKSNHENSTMLNFSCDKVQYTSGEDIQLTFPSPSDGKALVSVETGSKVIKKFWISTQKGETKYVMKATADMSPNAYIHVTLIQPHVNTKNDMPIRMYGVVPVSVDDPKSHLKPLMVMADVWKPESKVNIQVREEQGRTMNYTLAIVDEGLLDLTRFKTPQPWNTFYAREALGVKTWDIYDAVIGAYAGKLDKLLSIGGDGDGLGAEGVKANRFKPMVRFVGPFTLNSNQIKNHSIEIPNYCGSVRVMLVAENNGAYGSIEKAVAVKKPLMVLATLPRVLGPSESVSLPVDVFAMENHIKDVKVEVEVNNLLSIDGAKQQSLRFVRTGDEVINFKLNVAQKIGVAKVKVTATCGKEKSVQEIELDVRIANPKVVDADVYVLEAGKTLKQVINFKGLPGTNKAVIEVSAIPSLGLDSRLDYLLEYPHGCIEQTTSSVFPQLFVGNLIELKEQQKNSVVKHIKAGLRRLQLFQTSKGGFAYWPGENEDSEWGSNYAGHFMLEAEKQGYNLPLNMKTKWVKYQQQMAKNWQFNNGEYNHPHGNESNQHMQAYRLFVLALAGSPELSAMNRMREEGNLSVSAKWRLAAAYQLVGQAEVATQLVKNLPVKIDYYRELSYSYGSDQRDEAMILETLSLMKEKTRSAALAKLVAQRLNTNAWMSTQETAYNLLAMCQYTGAMNNSSGISYTTVFNSGAPQKQQCKKVISTNTYTDAEVANNSLLKLTNTGASTLYVKVMRQGIPLQGDNSFASSQLVMTIVYKNMKGAIIQPDKIVQGTDFMAEVNITNPGNKGNYKEMTLNQIFASGWEIHNNRMDEQSEGNNQARYQDIRDDRVYTYYDLPASTTKTFTVKLNATYLGHFYLPTVYSEAMYDQSINARQPGRWVEVIKDPGTLALK